MYQDKYLLSKLENFNDHTLYSEETGKLAIPEDGNIYRNSVHSLKYSNTSSNIVAVLDQNSKISFLGNVIVFKNKNTVRTEEIDSMEDMKDKGNNFRAEIINPKKSEKMTTEKFNEVTKNKITLNVTGGVYTFYGGNNYSMRIPTFGFDSNESPFTEYMKKVSELYEKIPSNIVAERNKDSVNHFLNEDKTIKKGSYISGEVMIPVMTGETKLPQICWGHAKYAIIPTEKYFNFLVIDHSKD